MQEQMCVCVVVSSSRRVRYPHAEHSLCGGLCRSQLACELLSAAPPEGVAQSLVSAARELALGKVPVCPKEWAAMQAKKKQEADAAAEAARLAALQAGDEDALGTDPEHVKDDTLGETEEAQARVCAAPEHACLRLASRHVLS